MITCGGQATIPMVAAVSRATPVSYAEIVASVASLSAGPGTRAEHRRVHPHDGEGRRDDRRRRERQGDHHPQPGRAADDHARHDLLRGRRRRSTRRARTRSPSRCTGWCEAVQEYVPGYRLLQDPQFDPPSPTTRGPDQGQRLPRGRGRGRLPAAVLREPRHHDRRGDPRGRRDGQERCMTVFGDPQLNALDRTWSDEPGPPADRHLPAGRVAPQAAPVHRRGGALHRSGRSTTPASPCSR